MEVKKDDTKYDAPPNAIVQPACWLYFQHKVL